MTGRKRHDESTSQSDHPSSSSPWSIAGSNLPSTSQAYPSSSSLSTSPSFTSIIPSQTYMLSSSSSLDQGRSGSNTSGSYGSGQKMPNELVGQMSSSSSSGSLAKSSTHGKARARVAMACVHCRQRKIRCDGQQPACSTCTRLGRACVYESISELENVYTREKKRRSKEVKQNRLKSLQGIGVQIPTPKSVAPAHGRSPVQSSASAGSSAEVIGGNTARHPAVNQSMGVGVIRDSRLGRQDRSRPYKAVPVISSSMQPPDQPQLRLIPPPLPHHRRTPARRTPSDSVVQSRSAVARGRRGSGPGDQGIAPVTSLSQPTTPEATYSMHASMLSRDLFSQQDSSSSDIVTSAPLYQATIQPSTLDRDLYRPGGTVIARGFDYSNSPTYQSGETSLSSRSSLGDATVATSTSSLGQTAAHARSGTSPTAIHQRYASDQQVDLDAQLALRRRSSFDVGDFWRRTSVADAAVANFFDRVIQARGDRKDSGGSGISPSLQRFPVSDSLTFASSSGNTTTVDPSEVGDATYTPVYGSMHHQHHHHHHQGMPASAALPPSMSANPDQFVYQHPPYDRRTSEENQQIQEQLQQQQWQQEERLHGSTSSPSSLNLHLGQLPGFDTYRQYPAPLHTGGSSTGSSGGGGGLQSSSHFSDPSHPLSAGMSSNTPGNPGFSYLTPPIPTNIAPPPLPTPMTELSSNMFAMGAPSHIGSYQHPSYYQDEMGHLHQHQPQQQQQQQSMAAFVSSRHGSLSSSSIPEEEGEEEYHR